MPTILRLCYTAYVEVKVPNKIARKLKDQDGVQNSESVAWAFGNKWGDLFYQGDNGKEYKISGETQEIDYKRTEEGEWEDEEESDEEHESTKPVNADSDDEQEVDGDGFVVCAKCEEGGGKCDGECE